jgi:sporulation-control protein spo0M
MNSDALKDDGKNTRDRDFLKVRSNMILDGVKLAIEIKRTTKNMILLHQASKIEIKPEKLPFII